MCSDGMGFSCLLLSLFVSAPGKSGSSEELPFRKQSVRFPSGLVVFWCGWSSGFYEQVKGGVRGLSIAQNSSSAGVRFELICRGHSSNPPVCLTGQITEELWRYAASQRCRLSARIMERAGLTACAGGVDLALMGAGVCE